jgi:sugar phosphate isomerase/epimerase
MQIFASTTSLGTGRTDLADVLPGMLELPLDGIELGSTHSWRSDLDQLVRDFRPPRIAVHNYFPPAPQDLVLNIASTDSLVRKASIDHARTCIDFAAGCGAEFYTIHPGFMAQSARPASKRSNEAAFDFEFIGSPAEYEESFALMCDALCGLLSHAQKGGLRLAIETEGSVTRQGMLLMEKPAEYRRLFKEFGAELWLNFNLAHSSLAAKSHGFDLGAFIDEFSDRFTAVEISHNDGERDQHLPLTADSYVFEWIPRLPDVPLVLEFREAAAADIRRSADMLRLQSATPAALRFA